MHIDQNQPHEHFDVKNKTGTIGSEQSLRQLRHAPDSDTYSLHIGNHNYPIVDYSAFGIAIRTDSNALFRNIENASFMFGDINAGDLEIRLVRRQIDDEGNHIAAFEILNEPIDFDRLQAIKLGQTITFKQQQYTNNLTDIPDSAKAMVYEIRDWLDHLSAEVSELQESFSYTNETSIRQFEDTITTMVANYLRTSLNPKLDKLAEILSEQTEETKQHSIQFLQRKLSYLIHQAPFADRVYNKPLGYAGDFEMMNLIYRQETVGRSLFARCLQRYYINEPAAQAVRNRADYLESVITPMLSVATDKPIHLLSVACGPAMEWQKILHNTQWARPTYVELIDQDIQALQYTQAELKRLKRNFVENLNFTYTHAAIKNVIAKGIGDKRFDLIYSAGLFDYLSDSVARKAASRLYKAVKPGGALIIGNFNINNPTTLLMEYALDWELIYRSENDLINLFGDIGDEIEVQKEPLGINLFCVIRKTDEIT